MRRSRLSSRLLGRGLAYLVAVLIALWILIPIYLITVAAFSPPDVIYGWPKSLLPKTISLETLLFFINAQYVLPSLWNSVKVALLTLVISLAVGAPAGYALARHIFPGKDIYRIALLSTRAFPVVILSIPLAVTFIKWDLYDTLVTSSVFIGVSRELEEAAMIFGCNRVQAFIRVALPLALPGLAASAIFTFVLSWNEVFAATILTLQNRTLPARMFVQLAASPVPFRFAGGFFILVPALLFMFFIRRYLFSLWGITLK